MMHIKRNIFIVVIILAVSSIGYVAWQMYFKYLPAEGTLKNEVSALSLPPEFKLQSSTYTPGSCLDNCPKLRSVYAVDDTREHVGRTLKQRFEAIGYTVDYTAGNISTGNKDGVEARTHLEPELTMGTADYGNNDQQQSQPVSTLTVDFDYRP